MQLQRLSPCGAPGLHLLRRIAPRAARLAAASLQHATRRRIRQTPVLLATIIAPITALLLAALLLAACGGDASPASGTPNTERAERTEREQTVAQQQTNPQQQAQAEESTASQPAEQPDPQPDPQPEAVAQQQDAAAPPDQPAVEAEVEDESQQTITFDDQRVERIAADLAAHRAGLPTARNALGDPAAPVLIVEYGDFQ